MNLKNIFLLLTICSTLIECSTLSDDQTDPSMAKINQQLLDAAEKQDPAGVLAALGAGADINTTEGEHFRTALMLAIEHANSADGVKIIKMLLEAADTTETDPSILPTDRMIHATDNIDEPALFYACANHSKFALKILHLLLEAGANPNQNGSEIAPSSNALSILASNSNPLALAMLLKLRIAQMKQRPTALNALLLTTFNPEHLEILNAASAYMQNPNHPDFRKVVKKLYDKSNESEAIMSLLGTYPNRSGVCTAELMAMLGASPEYRPKP